jgi:hypothetical protein
MHGQSPKRGQRKPPSPCADVEKEFTKRFLLLFTTLYDTPSMEPILTFPPAPPPDNEKPPEKIPPFHSGVWDVRLRKQGEPPPEIERRVPRPPGEAEDLDAVFQPRKTERSAIPLYIQNLRRDRAAALEKQAHAAHEDLYEVRKLFTRRVAQQHAVAKQRAVKRFSRAKQIEKEYDKFLNGLPRQADIPEKQSPAPQIKRRESPIRKRRPETATK